MTRKTTTTEVNMERECGSLRALTFENGTNIDLLEDEVAGFKIYGRRRLRGTGSLFGKSFFDKPFSIKASSANVRKIEVSYPDHAALRDMGLATILLENTRREHVDNLNEQGTKVFEPMYKLFTLTASQFASDVDLQSMTLELLLKNDEVESQSNNGSTDEECQMSGTWQSPLITGRKQILLVRGTFCLQTRTRGLARLC